MRSRKRKNERAKKWRKMRWTPKEKGKKRRWRKMKTPRKKGDTEQGKGYRQKEKKETEKT